MRKFVLILFVAFSVVDATSQELEEVKYTVKLGETVRMISRKFQIAPSEIYRLNRFAVDGIKEGMVLDLLVPIKEKKSPETQVVISESFEQTPEPESEQTQTVPGTTSENVAGPTEIKHTVAPKETLYSLSKKYNIPVDELRRQNETLLRRGLQIGQVLTIRTNN